MTQVTDSNYKEILSANAVCMFDFSATWCGPCKKLAPIVEKVDVDDSPEFTDLVGVRNVPTVVFYKNGELQADRLIGASDKSALTAKLNALL